MKKHRGSIEKYCYRLYDKNNPIAESWENLIFTNNPPDFSFHEEENNPQVCTTEFNLVCNGILLEFHNNNPEEMSGPMIATTIRL